MMKRTMRRTLVIGCLPAVVWLLLAGCGGGGGNGGGATVQYTVTPSVGANGVISPATAQRVGLGETVSFTVTPASGHAVVSVTGCGGMLVGSTYTTGPVTGNCTITAAFAVPLAAPVIQLARTGQTSSYVPGDDGDLQTGAAWPNPRFTDNTNGTVTDNLTGLVWLKNANCFGARTWINALYAANTLASGACGLSDGSTPGQWRLPNIVELESLIDIEQYSPALPAGHPFTGVQHSYWSSSGAAGAWSVSMYEGHVNFAYIQPNHFGFVWPIRPGQ